MLQVFLYRKKTTRFESKILQSTNVLFYEDSYFTEEPDVSYHGFNSCVVSSKADYKTLDFLQKLEINHRNKLSSFYKPVKKTHLDILEAIIVPHSHNDPGWIKTFEGHYDEQSKYILSNMVEKMTRYKHMTFVWAEIVLLSKWWQEINETQKEKTRKLIKEGRLEILGGGWVVPDEATTHYESLLNNFLEGHLWLKKHLNYTPTTSWSLDPFGYSAFLPHLYKKMSLQNTIILRVHSEIKDLMMRHKLQHFMWRPVWSASEDKEGSLNDMNTFMLPYKLYNIKFQCGPDNDVCLQFDFRQIAGEFSESVAVPVSTSNIYRLTSLLAQQLRKKANLQRNNRVVMFPLGDDFRYDKEVEWDQQYSNYMKLINFINSHSDIFNLTIRFGTVRDFFEKLNSKKTAQPIPTLSGDFFPYSDVPDDYWTGYFTSRIWLKKSIRTLHSLVHAAELIHLKTLFLTSDKQGVYARKLEPLLNNVRSNVSLLQHHDAITGTSTKPATLDFFKRSTSGLQETETIIRQSFMHTLAFLKNSDKDHDYAQFIISSESLSSKTRKVFLIGLQPTDLILFNPLINTYVQPTTIHVETDHFLFSQEDTPHFLHLNSYLMQRGHLVTKPLDCVLEHSGQSKRTYVLHFSHNLAPLSYQFYQIFVSTNHTNACIFNDKFDQKASEPPSLQQLYSTAPQGNLSKSKRSHQTAKQEFSVTTKCFKLFFNKATGHLIKAQLPNQPPQTVQVNFYAYTANGDGPYLFKPLKAAVEMVSEVPNKVKVTKSRMMYVVDVRVEDVLRLKYRLPLTQECSGGVSLDLELTSNMKKDHDQNQEIVLRVDTRIKSGFHFYTDSNGFNPMLRKRMPSLNIAANFYPATSYAFIESQNTEQDSNATQSTNTHDYRLSLLMSEPHGVSSQAKGQLEVMVDRMTTYDDGKGVSEGLNDNKATTVHFKLLLDRFEKNLVQPPPEASDTNSSKSEEEVRRDYMRHPTLDARLEVEQMRHRPVVAATTSLSPQHISTLIALDTSFSPSSLPCDVTLASARHLYRFALSNNVSMTTYLALHRFSWQAGFHVSSFEQLHNRYGCHLSSIASQVVAPTPLSGVQSFKNCHFNISSLFPPSHKITQASSASLTLLHRRRKVDPYKAVCLNASSLNAFLVGYKTFP